MSSNGRSAHGLSRPCAGCSSSTAGSPVVLAPCVPNTSAQTCTPGSRTLFRDLADSCLLLVDRELQASHDLAQSLQGLSGLALPAQDHEIIGVGHDATAEASLQSELLPPQHEPPHIQISQQR